MRSAKRFVNDAVDQPERLQSGRGNAHRLRCFISLLRTLPEYRGTAFRRYHGVGRVLQHQHRIADGDRQRSARSALTNDAADQRHFEFRHNQQVAADSFGLTTFLRVDTRISTRRIDESQHRDGKLFRQFHQPQCFPITFRARHAEVAQDFFLGVATLLVADHHHRLPIEACQTTDNSIVICKSTVAVQLFEIGEHVLDIIQRIGALRVARHLGDHPPVVVFVTAYDQHAVEAFEIAALDYVLKPIRRDRLAETVRRVVQEVRTRSQPARGQERAIERVLETPGVDAKREPLRRLPVRHRREVKLLDLADVTRIVSRDRLVLACAEGHEFMVDYTLQELEERLPRGQFVRVHRAALVNIDAIESYGGEDGVLVLKLKDGTRIEASERRAAEVRRRLK